MSSIVSNSAFLILTFLFILLQVVYVVLTDVYRAKFKNYSIYEVIAFNTHERELLYRIHTKQDDMVFINGVTNEASIPMDVLVDKYCTSTFESILQNNDIEYLKVPKSKMIFKLGDLKGNLHQYLNGNVEPKLTREFLNYDTIRQWIKHKIKKNTILDLITIGQTYEKRDIFVLKISTSRKNKAVFIMGGEEGRDWTSPTMLLNLVDYMLTKKKNLEILLKHYDFYILPMFNPDGYMYSMMKERVWAKNTRVYFPKSPCSENMSAVGINIDRNWYYDKMSVKNEECDPVYIGSKPLSEEETIAVSIFLNKIALRMMAFINIRGFENLVTIPYAYDKKCNNFDVLIDIASSVHDAVVEIHNSTFFYGQASKYVYNFTGNIADWVKNQLNTPIVYTFYMKMESYILPSTTDVEPLTAQLSTMIKQVLLLANTFYGPLFNNQLRYSTNFVILVINMGYLIISSVFK